MLTKRIIACLDVKDGRTVKGLQFEDLVDAGDAIQLAKRYSAEGVDELVFLDIAATLERRNTFVELVSEIAAEINIPFTVGGGIKCLKDIERLLRAGADKVSVNTAALDNFNLIEESAKEFGSQCLVVAIDSNDVEGCATVFKHAGKTNTELKTVEWAKKACALGAGEILLTAIDRDGSKQGFHCELTKQISEAVSVPVIASGGAGSKDHFLNVFETGKADAALAASIFHYQTVPIFELKSYLKRHGLSIRL